MGWLYSPLLSPPGRPSFYCSSGLTLDAGLSYRQGNNAVGIGGSYRAAYGEKPDSDSLRFMLVRINLHKLSVLFHRWSLVFRNYCCFHY